MQQVGIREFRENLADYLESTVPVAVTRHGTTIGFYIPAKRKPSQEALEKLRILGEQIDAMLREAGVTEDELVAEFKSRRAAKRR